MSDVSESLIRKIQKLLALSGSNPNEHEAQSAAAMAQRLLAEHGLELAEVQAHQSKTNPSVSAGPAPRMREKLQASAMYAYQQNLMRCIASNNFCFYMVTERTKEDPRARTGYRTVKAHTLIGSHLNVTVATMLYDYLTQTMDRLLPWQGTEKRGKDALLWLAGCTDRLSERLDRMRREQVREDTARRASSNNGTALVTLADVYSSEQDLNMDHLYGQEPGTTARQRMAREAAIAKMRAEMELQRYEPVTIIKAKPETAKERTKRENQERRWREQSDRRWEKLSRKYNTRAYRMGNEAGADIGLDSQITTNPSAAGLE